VYLTILIYCQIVQDTCQKKFNPENILDLGCGNGNITSRLLPLYSNARYTLLDASQQMLSLCKKIFQNPEIQYVQSYFNDFSFKEDHYDLIVAGFSIHHCKAKERIVPKNL